MVTSKRHKLTLLRLANHDFRRSLRVWSRYITDEQVIKNLVDQRAKSIKVFLQAFALCLLCAMWLQAGKTDLTAKYELIELSVPSFYISFALAMTFSNGALKLINYFFLNEFLRIACNKLCKFDNPLALAIAVDGQNAWSMPLWRQFRCFNSGVRHRLLVNISVIILMTPLIMLCVFIIYIYFVSAFNAAQYYGSFSLSGVLFICGVVMILFPFIYSIFLFLPLSFDKNLSFIRWIFLFRLYRRHGIVPNHIARWLPQVET